MSKKSERKSAALGLPAVNEEVTLEKIGKYFLDHLSVKQFTEWVAIANSYAAKPRLRFNRDRKDVIREALFHFGFITIPCLLNDECDRPLSLGEQFDHLFTISCGFKEAKMAISDIGCLFLEEAGRYRSDAAYVEYTMKPITILLAIAEMYGDYEFQKNKEIKEKKVA